MEACDKSNAQKEILHSHNLELKGLSILEIFFFLLCLHEVKRCTLPAYVCIAASKRGLLSA